MAFDTYARLGASPEEVVAAVEANPERVADALVQYNMTPADLIDIANQAGIDTRNVTEQSVAEFYNIPTGAPTSLDRFGGAAEQLAGQPVTPAPVTPAPVTPAPVTPAPVADRQFNTIQDYMDYYGFTDADIQGQIEGLTQEQLIEGFRNSGIQDLSGVMDYINTLQGTGYGDQYLDPSLLTGAPSTFANLQEYMDYYGFSEEELRAQLQGKTLDEIQAGFQRSGIQDLGSVTDMVNRLMGTQYTGAAIDPTTADIFQPEKFPTSTSYSGLPQTFTGPLLEGLLPQLQQATTDLPGQIGEWTEQAKALSQSASRNLLEGAMTNQLADLAKRGVLQSSVAEKALGRAGGEVARGLGQEMAQIGMQGATLGTQVPGILAGIANLGQYSQAQNIDPLAPYQLYADFISGLQ